MRSMRTGFIALAVAIIAAAAGSAIAPQPATAQEQAKDVPIVIGTLDVPELLTQSKAGKSLASIRQHIARFSFPPAANILCRPSEPSQSVTGRPFG